MAVAEDMNKRSYPFLLVGPLPKPPSLPTHLPMLKSPNSFARPMTQPRHDLYVIQASTLTPEEHGQVQAAGRQYADQGHLVDNTVPVSDTTVLTTEPKWNY